MKKYVVIAEGAEIKNIINAHFAACTTVAELQTARDIVESELKAFRDSLRDSRSVAYMDDLRTYCLTIVAIIYNKFYEVLK